MENLQLKSSSSATEAKGTIEPPLVRRTNWPPPMGELGCEALPSTSMAGKDTLDRRLGEREGDLEGLRGEGLGGWLCHHRPGADSPPCRGGQVWGGLAVEQIAA